MADGHMKRSPTLLSIRELRIKPTIRSQLRPVKMAIIKKSTINVREGVERREPSYTIDGNISWYSHYGKWHGGSSEN